MAKKMRMYAVSCDDVGLIAGTMSYSRRDAISQFVGNSNQTWEQAKHAGYRTVQAAVEIISHGIRRRNVKSR